MEKLNRYKLRKVKKRWVTVAVTSVAAVAGFGAGNASADEVVATTTTDAPDNTVAVEAASDTASAATATTADAGKTYAAPAVDATAVATPAATPAVEAKATEKVAETKAAETPAAKATTAVAENKVAAPAAVTRAVEAPKAALASGITREEATAITIEDKEVRSHIRLIDGKVFYVDDKGEVRKNFLVQLKDGKSLYFNAETGALVSTDQSLFTNGYSRLDTDVVRKNGFYNITKESIETVDGYLTADSWYRPKEILRNGENWEASSEIDFRPLLMTWWPDKVTQVNYVNFMTMNGLGSGGFFTIQDSMDNLNAAAYDIQKRIEAKIARDGSTEWLRESMKEFVSSQPGWNASSESETTGNNKDHLQGGALLYSNNKLTEHADSAYRILNRTPTNQTGTPKYFIDKSMGGYEFLLANDVDNSNPIVQAEQLNWLHYLMNFGSIVANDPDANFDGVRVDAVDNVNADLLQIASDYFKEYYGVADSEAKAIAHLSILEAWSDNDPDYNKDTQGAQLPIDNKLRLSLLYSFMRPLSVRSGVEPTITNSLNDRSENGKSAEKMANYIFVRAHDSEVQTVIADIIKKNINSNTDGLTFTMDELKQAFKIYNDDMRKAEKEYTQFNIPSAYALMLSNKDTIPRVYYGDLYTDDGQYMATKSPYFEALDALMRARVKYVSGGQDMGVHYMGTPQDETKWNYNGVLTSVRYGKGAESATDLGTEETRTQGMAVITANNPNLKWNTWDKLELNMGAAHKNQAYRPLLLTTKDGIVTFKSDQDAANLVRYTDDKGNLTFTMDDVHGYSNVQVSGYLAVWVPVGADDDQDARTAASTEKTKTNQVYNSSAALDSQLIYEGFSNFQDFAKTKDQYMNRKVVENADLFKAWGITSFEMPPQYVSSDDTSFLDSIIKNGYAFDDRYDLAMSQDNKYGSKDDLLNALRALHKNGIQAIADWVPDQIYNLPGKEVVTATRVNNYGTYREGSEIKDTLYVANTRTDGKDYQGQYGGAFLDELKAKYPAIFERKQISTGEAMNTDVKITQWSAKYFNGTNILGRGAEYVLKDIATNVYFNLKDGETSLPKQLLSQLSQTGFNRDAIGVTYLSTSGNMAKNAFVKDENGNHYYFDANGYMVTGAREIDGENYYFMENGVQLRDGFRQDKDGNRYYYNSVGIQYRNNYFSNDGVNWRYFDENGVMAVGMVKVRGSYQYFDDNGYQVKDKIVTTKDGKLRYFDAGSGNLAINKFAKNMTTGDWYYFGADGVAVTGIQTVNGKVLYFEEDGAQVKNKLVDINGKKYFFLPDSGEMAVLRFQTTGNNDWYYFGADGVAVTGIQTINGQTLHFDKDGVQSKGKTVESAEGLRYFDANSGQMAVNRFIQTGSNKWAYFNNQGLAATGWLEVDGAVYYFHADGRQAKGEFVTISGQVYYFDPNSGQLIRNRFVKDKANKWYYFGTDGKAVKGFQTINGQRLYFKEDGSQSKGEDFVVDGKKYHTDANSGEVTAVN